MATINNPAEKATPPSTEVTPVNPPENSKIPNSQSSEQPAQSEIDQEAISSIRKSLETIPSPALENTTEPKTDIKHAFNEVLPNIEPKPDTSKQTGGGLLNKIFSFFKRSSKTVVNNQPSSNVVNFEQKREEMKNLVSSQKPSETTSTPSEPAKIIKMQDYLHEKDVKNSLANAEKGGDWVPAEEKSA